MPDSPSPDVPTTQAGSRPIELPAVFMVAAAGLAYFAVGDLSTTNPQEADYMFRPWPFLQRHQGLIGVVSLVGVAITGAALVSAWRAQRMPAPLPAQVAILTLFASWLGFGYRVTTAGVIGANIGGAMVMLMTPILGLVAVASAAGLGLRASRRANGPKGQAADDLHPGSPFRPGA